MLYIHKSYALIVLDGTSVNIRIYFIFVATRIIRLHFAADSMDEMDEIVTAGSVNIFYFCKSDVLAVQGHPRSFILAPIKNMYATSY